jgi:hypothetical protein
MKQVSRCPPELFRIARQKCQVRSMPGKFPGHRQAKTARSPEMTTILFLNE